MKSTSIKLLLCGCTIAVLGALALEGCSSSDSSGGAGGGTSSGGTSSGGKGGTSSGGASTGGTSSGGAAAGGASSGGASTGGTSSGGAATGGTSSGGTGGASGSTSSGGAGAGGTGTAGTGGTGGTGGGAHPTAQECTDFCTLDASTCTGGNAAYANVGVCQTDCLAYALGDDSDQTHMTATSGNNFACRAYHLQNAIKSTMPADVTTHCGHTAKVSSACM